MVVSGALSAQSIAVPASGAALFVPHSDRQPLQSTSNLATIERPLYELIPDDGVAVQTPYYLIDEARLLRNLEIIASVRERSGAKSVLALKCFSTWAVFDFMRPFLDGTTSSSLYEARLGYEKLGKEVHAYCVAFSDDEIEAVSQYASKVIFNSASQLRRFAPRARRSVAPWIQHRCACTRSGWWPGGLWRRPPCSRRPACCQAST